MPYRNEPFTFIDLFSGCGGISWGFMMAGFKPIAGVEILPDPAETYTENIGVPGLCQSVSEFVSDAFRSLSSNETNSLWPQSLAASLKNGVDVIVGGPPCQGYSPLGKMSRGASKKRHHRELNALWRDYLAAVELLRPKAVVTENVPEFVKSPEFRKFRVQLRSMGYRTETRVLNAYDYGVPQMRKRSFTLALKHIRPSFPPTINTHETVRDAIEWLSLVPDETNWHVGRHPKPMSIERYKVIPPGGNRFDLMRRRPDITPRCWLEKPTGTTDVFGRLTWDGPASTIRTEFFKPEKGRYLHPEADRAITHREAALLQTFPCTYKFVGNKTSAARQIGEAVPPRLAEALGRHLAEVLLSQLTV